MRLIPLVAVLTGFLVTGAAGLAQEATPIADRDPMRRAPAHVHAGTCDEPGEPVHPLADAGHGSLVADAAFVGPDIANAAMVSVSTVAAPLDQLAAGEHAIDVYRPGDGDETATRIACGVIGGFRTGDDLVFGLAEVNGSNYTGTAWLHDDDGSTLVTLFLVSGLAQSTGAAGATPVAGAEPSGDLPPAVEVAAIVVEDGAFATSVLNLAAEAPTIMHIANVDDQDYYFRISDGLVTTMPLPANHLTAVEFTTPSAGAYAALLLMDEDSAVGLDLMPVTVE